MYRLPRFRDAFGNLPNSTTLYHSRFRAWWQFLTSIGRIGLTGVIAFIQTVGVSQEIEAVAEIWIAMEGVQCRKLTVWAMAVKADAAKVQGRAGRIQMSRNRAQVVGRVNLSSSSRRDCRVYSCKAGSSGGHWGEDSASTGLYATVAKAENSKNGASQRFGSSEVYCGEGSSLVAVETVLENEGGKSVEDYKLRAHIFSESDIFFTALKNRNNGVAK